MTYYKHDTNTSTRMRRLRRVYLFLCVLVLGSVVGGGIYFANRWNKAEEPARTIQSKPVQYVAEQTKTRLQENNYFSFASSEDWTFVEGGSKVPQKFVYKDMNHTLVEHLLTVYIDAVPDGQGVAYVLPVILKEDGLMAPQQISPHCGKDVKTPQKNAFMMTYQRITFKCVPDSTEYIVAAGMAANNLGIPLNTPKGATRKVSLIYQDVTVGASAGVFPEVISSFKLK